MYLSTTGLLRTLLVVATALLIGLGCSDDETDEPDVGTDDVEEPETDTGDDASDDHVDIDLDDYLDDAPDPDGTSAVFEASDGDPFPDGPSATGRPGDYILENDIVRFVVEQDERNISACPWGGNIIDAEYRAGDYGGDILGEICLFLNADQTFQPDTYDILHDGSDGAAVLAVTGETEILDYLNVEAMIAQMAPSLADFFELKPDDLLPLTITKYYILRPGDAGVRVVTAMRNDGDDRLDIVPSHLFVSGADGSYFNPLSSLGGFGYVDRGLADPNPDTLPFLTLLSDEASVSYAPTPDDRLDDDLPIAGAYLTIFNVVASVLGQTDIIGTLTASEDDLADREGVLNMEPDDVEQIEYWAYVGDGDLSTTTDVIYDQFGVETGTASGRVIDDTDNPVDGIRISAVDDDGRTMNQARTDTDGDYEMALPPGDYEFIARGDAGFAAEPPSAGVDIGESNAVDDLVLERPATLDVSVETPAGEPTPARVTLVCDGECPDKATSNVRDVTFDGLPDEFGAVGWVGVDGELELSVPAGSYDVVVSRGMEWSVWPDDTFETGGHRIDVVPGETVDINAEIARVVDTTGALSGDFHVHSLASLDSTTPKKDRILTFLTEGVDVVVSTDHDEIADYGPAVDELDAGDEITTLVGTEITTIDLGHFNGFPLMLDEHHRRGGAFDWGAGNDDAHPPQAIFDSIREHPDEQVVQLNHPDSSYLSYSDVVRGISYGDPDRLRVQMPDHDPDTGDTGIWSEDFTAMELMNGPNQERFYGVARWWLTLLGRGHKSTGTAVTDTHTRYGRVLGGVPRTFTFVDDDLDTPSTFDTEHFIESVNDRRAIGTNGPFVRVEATNDSGDSATFGETLETGDEAVAFEITIEVPEWVDVDTIEMIKNSEDVVTDPGEYDTDPIPATATHSVDLTDDELETVATGDDAHRRYRTTVDIDVETEDDAYVVFFIRGSESMYPILADDEIEPFAFTNPIFLDSDGDGYSDPHLAELAESEPPQSHPAMIREQDDEPVDELDRSEALEHLRDHHESHDHHGHHH